MEKQKTVGIWIRVSTEDQARGESPEHHEKRARYYAESKGWQERSKLGGQPGDGKGWREGGFAIGRANEKLGCLELRTQTITNKKEMS
jgi:hypothetical protein